MSINTLKKYIHGSAIRFQPQSPLDNPQTVTDELHYSLIHWRQDRIGKIKLIWVLFPVPKVRKIKLNIDKRQS